MNIFFIDDEPLTLHYLENIIDWEAHGIQVIGSASNGEDALKRFSEEFPDILITDIRMPVMNGIELIRAVRAISRSVKIIVLSAYSDFEYARSVFSCGVSGYLIKPIDEYKLEEMVLEAVEEINTEHREEEKERFTSVLAAETLLWEQITSPDSVEDLAVKFSALREQPDLSSFRLLSFTFSRETLSRNEVLDALQEASGVFKEKGHFIIHAETSRWLLLLESEISSQQLYRARDHLQEHVDANVYVTVSAVHSGAASLSKAYNEVKYLNALRFYSGRTAYVFYRNRPTRRIDREQLNIQAAVDSVLKSLLEEGIEQVYKKLDELDELVQEAYELDVYEYINYWTLFLLFIRTRIERQRTMIHMPEKLESFSRNTFQDCSESEELQKYIRQCLHEVARTPVSVPGDSGNSLVSDVKKFLHSRYSDKISLDTVAEVQGLSKNYLCRLFHQTTGVTVWDYLIMVRIEHAKEQLAEGDKSTAEIAKLVGYENQGYFSSVFKKKTGLSPRQYRNKISGTKLHL